MSERKVDAVFQALADPTRREVMRWISEEGPITVTELAGRLPVTRQAIAKHLDALEDAGLVSSATEGRSRRYLLTPAPMAAAMGWMADLGGQWDERLESLRAMFERRAR